MKFLNQRLRRAQCVISKKNALIRKLKAKIFQLENSNAKADVVGFLESSNTPSLAFLKSNLTNFGRKKKGRRYRENDKTLALAIYYCSSKAYKMLEKLFCLPTIRSLRRRLQNLNISPGINETILSLMKLKAAKLSAADRVVSVVIDEMSLKDNIVYDARSDEFHGFVDFGKFNTGHSLQHANHALVILVRG